MNWCHRRFLYGSLSSYVGFVEGGRPPRQISKPLLLMTASVLAPIDSLDLDIDVHSVVSVSKERAIAVCIAASDSDNVLILRSDDESDSMLAFSNPKLQYETKS